MVIYMNYRISKAKLMMMMNMGHSKTYWLRRRYKQRKNIYLPVVLQQINREG